MDAAAVGREEAHLVHPEPGAGTDVADGDPADVGGLALDLVGAIAAAEVGEGDGVVLREAGEILDEDVVAARAEVDAVAVLDPEVLPVDGQARGIARFAVLAHPGDVRLEADVPDFAEGAEDEAGRPVALVA